MHQVCSAFFKHNTLIAGVLIKDWTGVKCNLTSSLPTGSTGLIGGGKYCGNNTMWYNWVLERAHYPKWQSLVDSLERRGISVGLYICPHLEEIPKHLNSGRRHLFAEVQQDDFFVKKKRVNNGTASATGKSEMSTGETTSKKKLAGGGERKGGSNQVQDNAVVGGTMMYNQFKRTKCGILDLTNFNATSWFKQAVREEVFSYAGASFWMTDMGIGGPPVDGVYTTPNPAPDHSVIITTGMAASEGESKTSSAGLSFHNSYAEKWAKGEPFMIFSSFRRLVSLPKSSFLTTYGNLDPESESRHSQRRRTRRRCIFHHGCCILVNCNPRRMYLPRGLHCRLLQRWLHWWERERYSTRRVEWTSQRWLLGVDKWPLRG